MEKKNGNVNYDFFVEFPGRISQRNLRKHFRQNLWKNLWISKFLKIFIHGFLNESLIFFCRGPSSQGRILFQIMPCRLQMHGTTERFINKPQCSSQPTRKSTLYHHKRCTIFSSSLKVVATPSSSAPKVEHAISGSTSNA